MRVHHVLAIVLAAAAPSGSRSCCAEVTYADCYGFHPHDSTASIQAAIDCPLAHTVVVRSMGPPWIVAPPPASPNATEHTILRAAVNFSSSNQLIIFE
eukprot:SAG11_NODE_17706_length_511_cov_0.747573_1_plen_97_part_10